MKPCENAEPLCGGLKLCTGGLRIFERVYLPSAVKVDPTW